jgi:glyoxylase-like metal-dependent hydrolase (beta-lactamase superfamily II)
MNIVNVGYDSTNYYVLADTAPKLLIDVGFPGTLPKLQAQCKRTGVQLAQLKYFVCTHYHPDHAGMAQELKHTGIKLIVLETQPEFIPAMAQYMKPQQDYVPIELTDNVLLKLAESRAFLAKLGIAGEFISTPGHSDDSVSLILDDGSAFTGDLVFPMMVDDQGEQMEIVKESWRKIAVRGGRRCYPGHGPVREI